MAYQLRLSQPARNHIEEIVTQWGGSNSRRLRLAIRKKLDALAEHPRIGRFDRFPRPIYTFNVPSHDITEGPFVIPIHAVYRILEDEEAILILDVGIIRF